MGNDGETARSLAEIPEQLPLKTGFISCVHVIKRDVPSPNVQSPDRKIENRRKSHPAQIRYHQPAGRFRPTEE